MAPHLDRERVRRLAAVEEDDPLREDRRQLPVRLVDAAYRGLAAIFPRRIATLDGTRPPTEIAEAIREQIRAL